MKVDRKCIVRVWVFIVIMKTWYGKDIDIHTTNWIIFIDHNHYDDNILRM